MKRKLAGGKYGSAVFVRTLQLQRDLPGAIMFEPFIGDGRPGDIAAEMLEFCTLIGEPVHVLCRYQQARRGLNWRLAVNGIQSASTIKDAFK